MFIDPSVIPALADIPVVAAFTLAAAAFVVTLISAAVSGEQAHTAGKKAASRTRKQQREVKRQAGIESARERRCARIRAARLGAAGAAGGVSGSLTSAPIAGIETAAQTQQDIISETAQTNIEQLSLSQDIVENKLKAQQVAAISSVATTAADLGPAIFGE